MSPPDPLPDEATLQLLFAELNARHFGGEAPACRIAYNGRLSSAAGRITYRTSLIELSTPHLRRRPEALRETLLHEMIHAWCFARRGETGHGALFKRKMREVGLASIYHDLGVARPFDPDARRYLLRCPHCAAELLRRRRPSAAVACARCCRGRFDARFALEVYEITGLRAAGRAGEP